MDYAFPGRLMARRAALLVLLLVTAPLTPSLQAIVTYPTGTTPAGVVFDGANIWVANSSNNNVTKLLASTGATLGTYPVGSNPVAVTFDGANIWVANASSNNVTKLLASTGAIVGTYNVGLSPRALVFDSANIWVANDNNNSVTELLASSGATLGTFSTGTNPVAEVYDGTYIWVVNYGGNTVTRLLASTGAQAGTYAVGLQPYGVTFDGTNIWVANFGGKSVTKLVASTGALVGTFSAGSDPRDLVYDGANIWVVDNGSNSLTELIATTGAVVGTEPVGSGPAAHHLDGANIWVTNANDNNVTKFADVGSGPYVSPGGVVPVNSTARTIQPGEWVSIYGNNLASQTVVWNGNFPTSLGGTSVEVNGVPAYLYFVSSGQIDFQAPDSTVSQTVPVVVTTANGRATSSVTLGQFGPSFCLLDAKHVAGIILRYDGSGAYGQGTYDILGPTGSSLGYATVAAKAGDVVELFGVGFGPTKPAVPAGQVVSIPGGAPTTQSGEPHHQQRKRDSFLCRDFQCRNLSVQSDRSAESRYRGIVIRGDCRRCAVTLGCRNFAAIGQQLT